MDSNAHDQASLGPTLGAPDIPVRAPELGFDLLEGVRVLDLTTSVAGPSATMILADLGADVIKIEKPGCGDDARAWGPPFLDGESLWFLSVNRNKRSVVLDYTRPEGRAVLADLVAKCDIAVVNHLPAAAAKLGIDAATLRSFRADLVYLSITGFGRDGERANWACYDLIAEGYSGVMDLTGEPGREAQKVGAPAADMLAGNDAALAAIAALFARARTGKGRDIDIGLVDSMTRFLACRIVPYLGSGEVPRRSGGRDSVISIYQTFDTADEPLTLGLGNDNIWRRFWDAVGRAEIGADPKYTTNADRRAHRAEIVSKIAEVLAAQPRAHWLARFQLARIPAGPINRIDQTVADPALRERGLFYALDVGDRRVPMVGTGFLVDGRSNVARAAPPRLGEHTRPVLDGLLGYPAEKIDALAALGVI